MNWIKKVLFSLIISCCFIVNVNATEELTFSNVEDETATATINIPESIKKVIIYYY